MDNKEAVMEIFIIRESFTREATSWRTACDLALESLKKQIGKKPINKIGNKRDGFCGHCSVCGGIVTDKWNGCPKCLNAIDWS